MLIHLPSEQTSQQFAQHLATLIQPPLTMTFSGEIGMGKTTLIRALLRELGVSSAIKSPTFSLVESYDLDTIQLHHFDLYRIHEETELEYIGFRDYFNNQTICCIEWPERASHSIDCVDIAFKLSRKGDGRDLLIEGYTVLGNTLMTQMGNL